MIDFVATIAKKFTFDAAHQLTGLGAGHKCSRLHGHTYEVELVLRGPVGKDGFVLDYAWLDTMYEPLHNLLDHRYLNDIPGLEQPSTENLVMWMWLRLQEVWSTHPSACFEMLSTIRVRESSTTWCEITRPSYLKHG